MKTLRKDTIKKAIKKAVPGAMEGQDFDVRTNMVYNIDTDHPTGDAIVKAVLDLAKEKGVGADVKYYGDDTTEIRMGKLAANKVDRGDWNDPATVHHY